MNETTNSRTGHLAMSHTVNAVDPSPTRSPTSWARPPVSTTADALIASRTSSTRVRTTRTGSVFQTGRPSSMS